MDRYERIEKLGEGGQGKVYKVRRKEDGRVVVLKMINCADPTFALLAERETEIMRSCHHKHIIHFEESFRHEGKSGSWVCLVMEYCAGGDLFGKFRTAVQERKRFAEEDLHRWIVQTASGLQYMHDRDLWHRDIKAANILFDGDGCLKLGDFGLSTKYSPQGHKTVVGTPFYFAPEIMLGQEYSSKVDIWNLGVVMLELVTFKQTPVNCEVLQDEKKPERLMQEMIRDGYSKKLSMLIASMLSRLPCDRPSAREVLQQMDLGGDTLDGQRFAEGEAQLRDVLAQLPGFGGKPQSQRRAPPPVAVPALTRPDSNPGQQRVADGFNSPRVRNAQERRSHTPTERRLPVSPHFGGSPIGSGHLQAHIPAAAAAAPEAGADNASFGMRGTVRQLASHFDQAGTASGRMSPRQARQSGGLLGGLPTTTSGNTPPPPQSRSPPQQQFTPRQNSRGQSPIAHQSPPMQHIRSPGGAQLPATTRPLYADPWGSAGGQPQAAAAGVQRPQAPPQTQSPPPGVQALWQQPAPAGALPGRQSPQHRTGGPTTPLGQLQGADAALRASPAPHLPQRPPGGHPVQSPRGLGDSELQQLQAQLQRLQQLRPG
eukprot:TRINITY_DN30419_c0_g1_i1.p1 TRINITY_DN30419_c0_g1~~TRINITY_DN30419_c0_g1_i1.p1  ORF type:complete len:598 (+),score=91.26 TRINITY_DN30419_c0_g1_i1:139-1932(+)